MNNRAGGKKKIHGGLKLIESITAGMVGSRGRRTWQRPGESRIKRHVAPGNTAELPVLFGEGLPSPGQLPTCTLHFAP